MRFEDDARSAVSAYLSPIVPVAQKSSSAARKCLLPPSASTEMLARRIGTLLGSNHHVQRQ